MVNAADRIHACGGGHAAVLRDETWDTRNGGKTSQESSMNTTSATSKFQGWHFLWCFRLEPSQSFQRCLENRAGLLPFNSTLIRIIRIICIIHGAFKEAWYFSKPLRSSVLTQKQDCNQKHIPASHKINHFVIVISHDFRHIKNKSVQMS